LPDGQRIILDIFCSYFSEGHAMPHAKVYKKKKSAKQINKEKKAQARLDAENRIAREREEAAAARMKAITDKLEKQRVATLAKAAYVNARVVEWNREINDIVRAVLELRANNGGDLRINAGRNDAGTTEGGTDNPLVLAWPSGAPSKVRKSDAVQRLAGIDNSDSGLMKVRRKGVMVHLV
jgi:hypothetical protein